MHPVRSILLTRYRCTRSAPLDLRDERTNVRSVGRSVALGNQPFPVSSYSSEKFRYLDTRGRIVRYTRVSAIPAKAETVTGKRRPRRRACVLDAAEMRESRAALRSNSRIRGCERSRVTTRSVYYCHCAIATPGRRNFESAAKVDG